MMSAGIEGIGMMALVVTYVIDSSWYENILTKLWGRLALADVFTKITSSNLIDVSGLLLYVPSVFFRILTIQAIQKRRWS